MEDIAKKYANGIEKAVKELNDVFEKQGHSGFSAYLTTVEFLKGKFYMNPAWLISGNNATIVIGGPQELQIHSLNKHAEKFKLDIKITKAQ